MKTINSISGGKTSAYIAANYKADLNLFALVTSTDKKIKYPDPKIRQIVSDKIGKEFVATLEDDIIIQTMLDLEQYIGQEITWVAGKSFEKVIEEDGRKLPDVMRRYCTQSLKLLPMFNWWLQNIKEPVEMRIGFRANEQRRAKNMNSKLNSNGFLEQKYISGKSKNGNRNKWSFIEWQKPVFPLIKNHIFKDQIEQFWSDKPVKFAPLNNCVGCFHKEPVLLRLMWEQHPKKMQWFADKERKKNERDIWLSGSRPDTMHNNHKWCYNSIKKMKLQSTLFDDFSECDSGFCGL